MNSRDVFVALEIVEVESQNLGHLMNAHSGNDSSVVNLDPGDSMLKHELSPCRENFWRLGENSENCLEAVQISRCLLRGKAQTVPSCRSSGSVPKLDEILRKAEQLLPGSVDRK